MSRDKQIDYKEFADQMRKNACRNADGLVVCTKELWELIASTVESKHSDLAEEIFAEIERSIFRLETPYQTLYCIDDGFIAELKKKYTQEK